MAGCGFATSGLPRRRCYSVEPLAAEGQVDAAQAAQTNFTESRWAPSPSTRRRSPDYHGDKSGGARLPVSRRLRLPSLRPATTTVAVEQP